MKVEITSLEDRCKRMAAKLKEETEIRQESEEKVAFIFKKFLFVSQRCKLLEETCRALLDASASANEQAMVSVKSIAGLSPGQSRGVSATGLGLKPTSQPDGLQAPPFDRHLFDVAAPDATRPAAGLLSTPTRPRPQLPPAASFLELLRMQRRNRVEDGL